MTREEVKAIVLNELAEMEKKTFGMASDEKYQIGKITGMLKAFRIAGMINEDDASQIKDEIFWS